MELKYCEHLQNISDRCVECGGEAEAPLEGMLEKKATHVTSGSRRETIAELKAQLAEWKETTANYHGMLSTALSGQESAEAKLDSIAELKPFVLRDDKTFAVYYDELQAILEEQP